MYYADVPATLKGSKPGKTHSPGIGGASRDATPTSADSRGSSKSESKDDSLEEVISVALGS
jgi:hypothetical protein